MRLFTIAAMFCATFFSVDCQRLAPTAAQSFKFSQMSSDGRELVSINAQSMSVHGNVTHLQSPEIVIGAIVIRANQADYDRLTGEFRPRGNVRISTRQLAAD